MSVDASWILDGGGASATPPDVAASPDESRTVSLFVRGLLVSFQRDQKNDFANGTGAPLLRSRVELILGTAAAAPDGSAYGELEWDQAFGTQLHRVRHRRLNPSLEGLVRYFIAAAIPRLDPDLRLKSLQVVLDKSQRATRLRGKFQPIDGRGAGVGPDIDFDVPAAGEESTS